ncbi:hypothetical protein EJK55_0363 [Moraxella catarrhalis]|uniref:Uncharacterized protein n=1 Tax=Moraxella catarrhalis TaxID=480 RepID=A0ABY0BIN0_MORCA|nr:hypothetical protein EJK54_0306 [Moraxella catarrhalis]RUO15305.1 hypothetical protein EJK55_0363 [Moraxella catarrhalis]
MDVGCNANSVVNYNKFLGIKRWLYGYCGEILANDGEIVMTVIQCQK